MSYLENQAKIVSVLKIKFSELLSTMSRATGNEFNCNGSFHEAFSSVLVLAQCLAILPVVGIRSGSTHGLRFTWKSFRTIYSLTAFVFAASYTVFSTCITLTKKITFNSIGSQKYETKKIGIVFIEISVLFAL